MSDNVPGEVAELDFDRMGFIDAPADRPPPDGGGPDSGGCPTYSQKLEAVIAGMEAAWKFLSHERC